MPTNEGLLGAMDTKAEKGNVAMLCPNLRCGKTVVAPANMRREIVRCPFCQTAFRVPPPPEPTPEVEPAKAAG